MQESLNFVVADDDRLVLRTLHHNLDDLGHNVIAEARSGAALIDAVKLHNPNIVIVDIFLEGMDGLSAIKSFSKLHQCAIIVISGCEESAILEHASLCPIQAYIPKPINCSGLAAVIAIAVQRFREVSGLRNEIDCANRRLAERVLVEKAKGILMKRALLDEDRAYQKLRTMARNSCQTIGQIASGLLLTEELLTGPIAK
jgi:response regulator NasT